MALESHNLKYSVRTSSNVKGNNGVRKSKKQAPVLEGK